MSAAAPSFRFRRGDAVLLTAAFLASVGLGCINLGIVFFAKDTFNPTPATVGWLAATWCVTYAFSCLGLRPVLSRFPPQVEIAASMGLLALLTAGVRLSPALPLTFACYALWGLTLAFFWPSVMASLSAGREGPALAGAMVRFNLAWCTGGIVSPYVCGALQEYRNGAPLWLAAALFMGTGLLVAPLGRGSVPSATAPTLEATAPRDQSTALRFPAWAGLFASYFGQGIMTAVFPLIGREHYGFAESTIGGLLLVRAFTNAAGFLGLGMVAFWHFRLGPMMLGQWLGAASVAALLAGHGPLALAAALAGFGLSNAMSYSGSIFHGVAGSLNRARRMAIHEATLSTGIIAGSVFGGLAYGHSGPSAVYGLGAGVLALSALFQAVVRERLGAGQPPPATDPR